MVSLVHLIEMLILVISTYFFITAKGDNGYLSNYTDAKSSCQNRGGLITQEELKFSGLINITCDLGVDNDVLKDGESVWVQGHAQTGPYIALHTCIRFIGKNNNSFAMIRTFYSNILYECSVLCEQILHSTGYLGIYRDSCFCIYESFRFPRTVECLDNGFMDRHKGLIVFKITDRYIDVESKSAKFNCLGASTLESGKTSYYNAKCGSTLYGMCQQRVDSELSNECLPRLPRLGDFCLNAKKRTFLEHYRNCWLYNGTLMPFNPGITVSLKYSVLLGSFRAFKAFEEDSKNKFNVTWSCLSITQVNGTIYVETENCSNKNSFYCLRKPSYKEEYKPTDEVTTNSVPIIILISIVISTVTAIAIAMAIAIWWTCRRCRKSRGTSPKDTPQQSVETENRNHPPEMTEEELPLYAESTILEAENNPSQYVPEVQQSINIYNHLQIWQDEDDNTYDMSRFHNV